MPPQRPRELQQRPRRRRCRGQHHEGSAAPGRREVSEVESAIRGYHAAHDSPGALGAREVREVPGFPEAHDYPGAPDFRDSREVRDVGVSKAHGRVWEDGTACR